MKHSTCCFLIVTTEALCWKETQPLRLQVVISIIEITDEYRKKGIAYNREKFRDFMKSLDLLAGRSRLAVLSKKQLKAKLTTLYLAAHE